MAGRVEMASRLQQHQVPSARRGLLSVDTGSAPPDHLAWPALTEVEAGGEAPVVVLIHNRLLKVRTASEELAAVAVREAPVAAVGALALRAAVPSESSSPELLPWFPIIRSSAVMAATAAQAELVLQAPSAATAELVDWVPSSAPALRVAAETVERVVPDPAAAAAPVARPSGSTPLERVLRTIARAPITRSAEVSPVSAVRADHRRVTPEVLACQEPSAHAPSIDVTS